MGRQGDSIIIKRGDLSRKRDNKVEQAQEQVPHSTTPEVAPVTYDYDDGYYLPFKSREKTFNEILEALQDDGVSRVGLCGERGAGKTTLAKQVCKRAKELNLFSQIVFILVTPISRMKKIQGEIADQLGLRLGGGGEGEEVDLAAQIMQKLSNERILIILDNVFYGLNDLREIGNWSDGEETGSKVLLITCSREIGYPMGSQRIIHLYVLTDEEALHLLWKRAGTGEGTQPDLTAVAVEIAKQCGGDPYEISLIGSALRSGKTVEKWMEVLQAYQRYKVDEKMVTSWVRPDEYDHDPKERFTRKMLRLNYNGLNSKVAKAIFLMCALLEDDEILTDYLFQNAIRLRLCSCKNEVSEAINTLKDSFFLMHPGISNDRVMMPTYTVSMAVWGIVSEEYPTYAIRLFKYDMGTYWAKRIQQPNEIDRLLRQMLGVSTDEYPSSSSTSSSNAAPTCYGPHDQFQVATIPRPFIRKRVDFHGLCQVDESFLPLLKEACAIKPQLIESQRRHSPELRETAFDSLGRLLFLLCTVRKRDWANRKDELRMFWEQTQVMKFDLKWLKPIVEEVLSSTKIARTEALQKEVAKQRERLKILEIKVANAESELDSFAITDFSAVLAVSEVTPSKKFFFRK